MFDAPLERVRYVCNVFDMFVPGYVCTCPCTISYMQLSKTDLCAVMYTCCRLVQALYFSLTHVGTSAYDSVSLQDVLSFFSGAAKIPPLGFHPLPSLSFRHDAVYPTASTCALRLTLPTCYSDDYESFKYNMTQARMAVLGCYRLVMVPISMHAALALR